MKTFNLPQRTAISLYNIGQYISSIGIYINFFRIKLVYKCESNNVMFIDIDVSTKIVVNRKRQNVIIR